MNHQHGQAITMQQVYLIQVHGHNVSVEFLHDAPQGQINVHNVDIQVTTPGDRDIPFAFSFMNGYLEHFRWQQQRIIICDIPTI